MRRILFLDIDGVLNHEHWNNSVRNGTTGDYFNKDIDHRMITEYNFDYTAATEAGYKSSIPDVVVWECVERYLDRLCTDR